MGLREVTREGAGVSIRGKGGGWRGKAGEGCGWRDGGMEGGIKGVIDLGVILP
jgi:hypothetical protein